MNTEITMYRIVNVEAQTFEKMLSKFEYFANRLEQVIQKNEDKKMSDWMDNQDVCLLLNISPRTLQTLRDNGTLAFSRISHKIYYKACDVLKLVPPVKEKTNLIKRTNYE